MRDKFELLLNTGRGDSGEGWFYGITDLETEVTIPLIETRAGSMQLAKDAARKQLCWLIESLEST